MKFLFTAIVLVATTTAYGQARMPSVYQNRSGRMAAMDIGQKVLVFKEALVLDQNGRAWIDKNYIYDTPKSRYKSLFELEVLRLKSGGYAVTILYSYRQIRGFRTGFKLRTYPTWRRSYVSRYTHAPVTIVIIKKPPQPKESRSGAITRTAKPRYLPTPSYLRKN